MIFTKQNTPPEEPAWIRETLRIVERVKLETNAHIRVFGAALEALCKCEFKSSTRTSLLQLQAAVRGAMGEYGPGKRHRALGSLAHAVQEAIKSTEKP